MSEDNKITSVAKTKDPRKVEAGRLSAISKFTKKKAISTENSTASSVESASSMNMKELGLVVGVVGIAVGIAGLYYKFNGRVNSSENCTKDYSENCTKDYSENCSKDYSENCTNEKPKPKPVTKSRQDSLD